MKAIDYYQKGFNHARLTRVVAFGYPSSWQRKHFQKGYKAGAIYLQAEALLHGFEDVSEYQAFLIKQAIK